MRILIGNDIDDNIVINKDIRSWTQRILWFAKNGDAIILSDYPDPEFLEVVISLTGVDCASLKFHIIPKGRFDRKQFDHSGLLEHEFLRALSNDLVDVSDIIPLWPSPYVARFADSLDLIHCFKGVNFFSQNGIEICNNKASFRAFASSCSVPIPDGAICFSRHEAILSMIHLFEKSNAVMVKRAHGGAGAGNQLVTTDSEIIAYNIGATYYEKVEHSRNEIDLYWERCWDWASDNGRFPVVLEEYIPNLASVYAEFFCGDEDIVFGGTGELIFQCGRLKKERVGLESITEWSIIELVEHASLIAKFYQRMGYRGYLSPDAILSLDNEILFTEVNARFTGSTHLYKIISDIIVNQNQSLPHTIVQYISDNTWNVKSLKFFLDKIRSASLFYDSGMRQGVIPIVPTIDGHVVYAIVTRDNEDQEGIFNILNGMFNSSFQKNKNQHVENTNLVG